jgi:chromate transporter
VIANLALVFALHTLFDATRTLTLGPAHIALHVTTLDPIAVGIAILAAVLLLGLKWSVLRTLGICAAAGVASAAIGALFGQLASSASRGGRSGIP